LDAWPGNPPAYSALGHPTGKLGRARLFGSPRHVTRIDVGEMFWCRQGCIESLGQSTLLFIPEGVGAAENVDVLRGDLMRIFEDAVFDKLGFGPIGELSAESNQVANHVAEAVGGNLFDFSCHIGSRVGFLISAFVIHEPGRGAILNWVLKDLIVDAPMALLS